MSSVSLTSGCSSLVSAQTNDNSLTPIHIFT